MSTLVPRVMLDVARARGETLRHQRAAAPRPPVQTRDRPFRSVRPWLPAMLARVRLALAADAED